eukprot:434373-Pleurochrysis_carterae.AAC.1
MTRGTRTLYLCRWHTNVVSPARGSRYAPLTSDQQVFNHMMRKPNQWPGISAPQAGYMDPPIFSACSPRMIRLHVQDERLSGKRLAKASSVPSLKASRTEFGQLQQTRACWWAADQTAVWVSAEVSQRVEGRACARFRVCHRGLGVEPGALCLRNLRVRTRCKILSSGRTHAKSGGSDEGAWRSEELIHGT